MRVPQQEDARAHADGNPKPELPGHRIQDHRALVWSLGYTLEVKNISRGLFYRTRDVCPWNEATGKR